MTYSRIQREKRIIDVMIRDFCRDIHGQDNLCEDCEDLRNYAEKRLLKCPFLKISPYAPDVPFIVTTRSKKKRLKK